jgi:hypothetical protein
MTPTSFLDKVKKPLPKDALAPPPPKRCTKAVAPVPHRSSRLVKKACGLTPVMATTQNGLMKKLGIVGVQQLEEPEIEQYLKLFKEGLTVEQTKMIQDLFKDHNP